MTYFATEAMCHEKADTVLRDCTRSRVSDLFAHGKAQEMPTLFLETVHKELGSALILLANRVSNAREWEKSMVTWIASASVLFPHFLGGKFLVGLKGPETLGET